MSTASSAVAIVTVSSTILVFSAPVAISAFLSAVRLARRLRREGLTDFFLG